MKNKLSDKIYSMTNITFEEEMKLLFDMEEKFKYENNISKDRNQKKKKIAIVYDVDGWAYCNIATEIKRYLSKDFDIDIFPVSVFFDNFIELILLADRYDLVHCLWRGLLSSLDYEYARGYIFNMGLTFEEFMENYYNKTNITTSVYDHKFLDEENFEITKSFAKDAKNYTVSSTILRDIYNELDIDKKPTAVISDGVDITKFKPEKLERFDLENISNRKIKVGWVGNSEFTDSEGDSDLKGVRKIIKPALEELIEEGYPIELKFADRKEGYIPHDKMPDYYNSIDLYVCASKNEGTPNPVLESMASGVPVVSTNVGIVRDAFGEKQKNFILKERTKEDLKAKLVELLEHKEKFKELSEENLKQIKDWTWEKKCYQFRDFFNQNMKQGEKI